MGGVMSEKVVHLGIKQEPGSLHYLRGDEIWKASVGGAAKRVASGNFEREEGWFYFLDGDGDVSRTPRTVSPTRLVPASKPIDISLAEEVLAVRRPDGA